MLRRAPCEVPSSFRLDHDDILVVDGLAVDGLAQSEYEHRTVSGLKGARVILTSRWVTQHIASCPLAGVICCALPSCVQGLAEPGPHRRERHPTWCCASPPWGPARWVGRRRWQLSRRCRCFSGSLGFFCRGEKYVFFWNVVFCGFLNCWTC